MLPYNFAMLSFYLSVFLFVVCRMYVRDSEPWCFGWPWFATGFCAPVMKLLVLEISIRHNVTRLGEGVLRHCHPLGPKLRVVADP